MTSPRLAILAAALCACATSSFDKVRQADSVEAYRDYLRQHSAEPAAVQARARLAELEFQAARRQNTILAYKRFLDSFGESPRASDAQVLLEGLRFEAARGADSSAAWNEFLRDHPAGAHAAQARSALCEADFRAAKEAGTSKAMLEFLALHPDSPRRPEAEKAADDLMYAEAQKGGTRALLSYLEKSSVGRYRDQARSQLTVREALVLAELGEFQRARERAELIGDQKDRQEALARIDRSQLQWAAASLSAKELESFAKSRTGPLAEEARASAKALPSDGKLLAVAVRLDPTRYARPVDEMLRVLDAADPRDRWLAAEELGRVGALSAIDALLEASAVSRFARVRARAFEALRRTFDLLPEDAKELEVRTRLESLRKLAQGPVLQLKVSMLEELLGELRAAADDYAKAQRGDSSDLFTLARLAQIRARRGEGFSTAVAARDLASRVEQLVEQRSSEESLSPLLLARTLCGAKDVARLSVELISAIPAQAASDFPEDLAAFELKAEQAERLASARLADAEAAARAGDRSFKGCDDDGDLAARLAEGRADRLKAVAELAARKDPRVRPALEIRSRRDPDEQVRAAAVAALAGEGR